MARSVTGSFWLTETVQGATAAAGITQGTIDLGAYIDVGGQLGVAIEQVDLVWQRYDVNNDVYDGNIPAGTTTNMTLDAQLSDNNPGLAILRADSNTLIASGTTFIDDANQVATNAADLYPDTFGKLDEAYMVINDQLYCTTDVGGTVAANMALACTFRIKCRIVKLSTKDWMAIAVQSTAADN